MEIVKLANCLDQKRLERPPLTPEQMHDMNAWSEEELVIKTEASHGATLEDIINLDSDMTELQGSHMKRIKLGIQNKLKGAEKHHRIG